MLNRHLPFAFLFFCVVGCAAGDGTLDVLLVGGTVLDGTGAPGVVASVGVSGGRIALVGSADGATARDTIDVTGLVVAPGFVDVHNHTEAAVVEEDKRLNEGFVRQGVTTIVGGPDGSVSPRLLRMLRGALEEHGAGTNVASYVGHNAIRSEVMGDDQQRAPTLDEMERMKALIREGMEMGAVGFSTGLMYEPGMFSTTDEVAELAAEVAPFGGVYDSHVRNPVHAFVESHAEAIEVGARAGIPAKLGHLKSVSLQNEGKIRDIIAKVEEARASGDVVVSDQYPYDGAATSTLVPEEGAPGGGIVVVPPDLRVAGGDPGQFDLKTALRDPAQRARLKEASENGIDGGFAWLKATGYTSMRIVTSEDYPELVGKYLSELAEERRVDPFDVVAELALDADHPVYITLGAIKEWEVRELIVQPWNMIASDGAYLDRNSTSGHPRGTGTFPRLLGHYVRDEGLLPLEEAVRKITSFPADFLGLTDRGRIQEGLIADLVVFDPETIIDRSTWTEPQLFSEGVVHLLVNGVPVLRDRELTGEAPGRFVGPNREDSE